MAEAQCIEVELKQEPESMIPISEIPKQRPIPKPRTSISHKNTTPSPAPRPRKKILNESDEYCLMTSPSTKPPSIIVEGVTDGESSDYEVIQEEEQNDVNIKRENILRNKTCHNQSSETNLILSDLDGPIGESIYTSIDDPDPNFKEAYDDKTEHISERIVIGAENPVVLEFSKDSEETYGTVWSMQSGPVLSPPNAEDFVKSFKPETKSVYGMDLINLNPMNHNQQTSLTNDASTHDVPKLEKTIDDSGMRGRSILLALTHCYFT